MDDPQILPEDTERQMADETKELLRTVGYNVDDEAGGYNKWIENLPQNKVEVD